VVGFAVRQRARETGIRLALGEPDGSILWRLARGGLIRVAIGLAIGLALALLVAPALGALLFGVSPRDPLVYLGVAAAIGVAALAAVAGPAAAALRASPMEALRCE
jgi:putative ABC transport system permease protein